MKNILLDTSVLLDLVLYSQQRHRRNRAVASSAGAAVESILMYDNLLLESASVDGILETGPGSRFLEFYCDDRCENAMDQFRSLVSLCGLLPVTARESAAAYSKAADSVGRYLTPIDAPDDLRAYELYDYLPYHLGEDPTALECRVADPCVADLEEIEVDGSDAMRIAAAHLKRLQHPTRAAWSLPLIRLFYYAALQERYDVHFIPHASKSTLAFGREAETVQYRRLLEYCRPEYRESYMTAAREKLAGLMVCVPVPDAASTVLGHSDTWSALTARLLSVRQSNEATLFRQRWSEFTDLLEQSASLRDCQVKILEAFRNVESASRHWAEVLGTRTERRQIRVAHSLSALDHAASDDAFVLVHDLFSSTGVSGNAGTRCHQLH